MVNTEVEFSKFLRALADCFRQFADRLDEQRTLPAPERRGEAASQGAHPVMPGRLALKVPEAAKAIGISRASMYQIVASGEVRSVRIGRRILIPVAELQRLLQRLE